MAIRNTPCHDRADGRPSTPYLNDAVDDDDECPGRPPICTRLPRETRSGSRRSRCRDQPPPRARPGSDGKGEGERDGDDADDQSGLQVRRRELAARVAIQDRERLGKEGRFHFRPRTKSNAAIPKPITTTAARDFALPILRKRIAPAVASPRPLPPIITRAAGHCTALPGR